MFGNMKLGTKILTAFLCISLIPFVFIGAVSLFESDAALSNQAFGQLESMREVKRTQIADYLAACRTELGSLTETVGTFRKAAFDKLRGIQEIKKAQVEEYFRKCLSDIRVISRNVTIADALESFGELLDEHGHINEGLYEYLDKVRYGNSLRQYKKEYGYYDLLLITKRGNVVYTLNRESDLGQNVLTGTLKDSTLGRCFSEGAKHVAVQDFTPYPPSGDQYVSFVSAPVVQYGETIGVVALKLDIAAVNTMAQRRKGMGETGETWLAGRQGSIITCRSDQVIGKGKIGEPKSGHLLEKALSGESGTTVRTGSTGHMEIISYDSLNIPGLSWAMITAMNLEEVINPESEGKEDYFTRHNDQFGYDDLILIHPNGEVFYTVARKRDYGTNILTGEYADSGLGRLVRKVLETKQFETADFELYAPDNNEPAAFIARPVVNNGNVEVVVALKLSVRSINQIMLERAGMGETGETYLVGSDKLMRSDSYLDSENRSVRASFENPGAGKVDTKATREALSGKTGKKIITGYRGVTVLSAYTPLELGETTWALIAEIDEAEAFAAVRTLEYLMGILAAIGVALIIVVSFVITGSVTSPIKYLTDVALKVSQGDLKIRTELRTNDETKILGTAFNQMLDQIESQIREITEASEERERLLHELSRLTTILETTSDMVSMSTPEARLIYMNRAGRKMVGWRDDENLAVKKISDVHPEWALRIIETKGIPAAIGHGVWEGETAVLGSDNREIPVSQVIMSHRALGGEPEYLSTIMRDISERKRSQEALASQRDQLEEMNQELQRLDKLKDEFLANTSHELRTPLNGIIGIAESLIDGSVGPLTGAQQHNLSLVVSSARRLTNLVNDILDFSKLRQKDVQLRTKPVDIRSVADVVLMLSRTLPQAKGLDLVNQVGHDLPAVHADEDRLQQILHNLVGNAVKFTESGTISVSARVDKGYLAVTVSDTGIGIPKEKLGRIFESFEQADGSTAREYGGTGLGLAVTRQLTELHGGQIRAESAPGKGSRFTFTLPVSEDKADPLRTADILARDTRVAGISAMPADIGDMEEPDIADIPREHLCNGERCRILVVDDEPVNLQVLRNQLASEYYSVTLAADGREALDAVESGQQFELVLLDVMMPGMSGYEVCRHLREKYPANELPVVMLTAKNQIDDLIAGFDSGASDYLTKPFSRQELIARISTHLTVKHLHTSRMQAETEARLLSQEMRLARQIQTALIPEKPELPGYEIAASIDPADEVGGDYYDIISADGHDWIVIGDVSGHGVPAGLVMMMVQTAIHTVLAGNPETPPSHLLSLINRTIYKNIEKMKASKHMSIIVLAVGKKHGIFSFAGLHEDILIRRAGTGKVEKIESDGMWIGLEPDISEFLSDSTFQLGHGDCMVLFTDGITEALCGDGKLFGDDRLIEIVEASGQASASQLRENIITALEPCETPDDVTLVVMKRK